MEVSRSIPLKNNLVVEKCAGLPRAEKMLSVTQGCVA